jgi:integrase
VLRSCLSETKVRRRGHGEDAIYLDSAKNRYVGAVSLGFGPGGKRIRRKVSGKTKQEVRDKLKALHQELNAGVRSSSSYTVRRTVEDWLREGLDGKSQRTRTLYEGLLEPVLELIGAKPLRELSAGDVRAALTRLTGRCSTRSLQITRNSLERAIRHAEANDLVGRNVAALVKPPQGRSGRRSKSFTLDQAKALLVAAENTRMYAYVVLSLLVGIRTEEARALRWDHVVTWVNDQIGWQPITAVGFDLAKAGDGRYAIYVWRSDRNGGDTKTEESRRTLALPLRCVEALMQHWKLQAIERLRAGELWQEHGLVFASTVGTPLNANNVIRAFRLITKKAGLGEDWVPREMRHTFVSILSADGVPVENIAQLVGHDRTATTEVVYRHEIRPALTQGAEVMDKIFA